MNQTRFPSVFSHIVHACAVGFWMLVTACVPSGYATDLRLASLFTDHVVIQREQVVPVWGWAKPGDGITVRFSEQTKTTKADKDGKWLVKLDPMPAAMEGGELKVESSDGSGSLTLTDVVVGDVWLCSGQSNMHFPMKNVREAAAEIRAANNPAIRFFYVEPQFAQKPMGDVQGTWQQVSPETVERCSAVAYYFARDLQEKLGLPIGLVTSSVGGTRIETWMQTQTLAALGLAGPLIKKWEEIPAQEFADIVAAYKEHQRYRWQVYPDLVRAAKAQGAPVPPEPARPEKRPHDCPGALHNGMITPLQPFAIRGTIWYQGEGNIGSPYDKLLPAMIADWRKVWGGGMPFLIVQLPPHKTITPQFREAQFRVWQSMPHTAMVVTTDVGDAEEIHPPYKRPIGERLALAARAIAYGEPITYSGPVFESMEIDGSRAVISFTHVGGGLMAKGDALEGFVIAGADGRFFPGRAVIEGSTVVVSSDEVSKPRFVHFGNDKVPKVNLFNSEGLPAVPFCSDIPSANRPATQLRQP